MRLFSFAEDHKEVENTSLVVTVPEEHIEEHIEPGFENGQSVWEVVAKWSVYLIALLMPVWFLPFTINPVDTNKMFFVSLLAIVGFVAWLGTAIYKGVIRIPRAAPLYALGLWLVVYFLAALFSVSPEVSFWGSTPGSFFNILSGILIAFLAAVTLRDASNTKRAYTYILIAAAVVGLFMLVQTIFSIDIFQWEFAKLRTFHPIGQWNAIGIFFGFILVSLIPFLAEESSNGRVFRSGSIALAVLSLLGAAVVNFRMVWIGTAIIAVIYLAYHYSRPGDRGERMRYIVWPLLLLLLSILLYLSQNIVGALTFSINPPLDVTPSISSSLQIAAEVMQEKPMFGVGPNSFGYAWDRFKSPDVNTTVFWRLRFGTGSSFVTTLLTTTGILGAFAFLVFIGSVLWTGVSTLGKLQWDNVDHRFCAATFFGLLYLLYSWFVYPLTGTISVLTFLMIGLLVAQIRAAGFLSETTGSIRADSAKGFISALVMIFLMVFGVVGLYITSQKYVAAIIYGRGVALFNETGAVNGAERFFQRAVEFDTSHDLYYQAITQTSALKLRRSLENTTGDRPEDVRSAFQAALSSAISSAKAATEVHPGNAANWRLLGQIYEAVIPFVGGSADAAVAAYALAVDQSPFDPVLHEDIARVYISLGDHVKAREALKEAIRLKPDYAAAHFRLAQIAALKGNIVEAITSTEQAAVSEPNDIGVLFQLGLLYYQQDRSRDAELVLERAVRINPNYSNARYFLGLAYAQRGERESAVEQFKHIQSLNPDNIEMRAILANLEAGKDVLEGISPSPLSRGAIPVEKEGEELDQSDVLREGDASE
ncbi:MAG: Tfp pilus assembly protein PilF [Parcubacteria group bacterium Gr01-1014_29]|nr:MAG: Tfp pilus assembly protein PilF [Parcubacteria group bacterium Gr01-1014_29]